MLAATLSTELLQERLLYGKLAAHDLIHYARLTTPAPGDFLNVRKSGYITARHHVFVAEKLTNFAFRRGKRNLMLSMPYRHGKTELSVKKFVAWCLGKFPEKSGIVITHTDRLAADHGRAVRDLVTGSPHQLAFPDAAGELRADSQAVGRLQTQAGGVWMFVGRGTMGGGYGADWIVIDDFFKSDEEARSEVTRDAAYHTLIKDCYSRLNDENGGILLIGTRRHADDPQGRLLDPDNPYFDPVERAKWEVVVLPALAEADDPLGRAPDEPLWPERFSYAFWDNQRKSRNELVRDDFQVQGQCQPIPAEGKYFKKTWLDAAEYNTSALPRHPLTGELLLRFYGASDHAYRTGQEHDRSCLLVAGVDPAGTIWVMPETWWERAATDVMTEKLIDLMLHFKPFAWFAARDAISGSIKPFLLKRMQERRCYAVLDDSLREDEDLQRRAQSIRNRIAMGMVRFPRGDWWGEAKKELLSFPNGAHDDFVAALAMLGMALDTLITADGVPQKTSPKPGTYAWHSHGQMRTAGSEERKGWA